LCVFPRIETAEQGMHVFEVMLFENVRHTGARSFVRSSAIGHDRAVAWNVREMLFDLIGRDANRARQFRVAFRPSLGVACVDEEDISVLREPFSHLVDGNSFGHSAPPTTEKLAVD